jgi:ABC-2 type transport system ATP-binding protein
LSVHIENLTIRYGPQVAVDSVTVDFPQGSTGLLGPNGAGKSSIIKALLGLVPVSAGSAVILGRNAVQDNKMIRQLVGYMPEDDCLIPGLTGLEMVRYAGELSGMPPKDAMQRAHDVLFAVGLGEARYRKVETYSSGMKQRIKLAQAVVHDPKLLFLDEPTSGMDPRGRQEMLDLILQIPSRGTMSVVLATHILPDVERTCGRVVILNRGRVAENAKVEDLRGTYANAYNVRVDGDREEFEKRLTKQGCEIKSEGKADFDVTLPKGKDSDMILRTARDSGVVLRKLVPSIQTLEEVFVKKLREGGDAGL